MGTRTTTVVTTEQAQAQAQARTVTLDIDALRRDLICATWDAYGAAWDRAWLAGYRPQLVTRARLVRVWARRSEGHPLPAGRVLAVVYSLPGSGERPPLLIAREAAGRIAACGCTGRRLIAVMERIAAHTPTGKRGGTCVAVETPGGAIQYVYVTRPGQAVQSMTA